MGVTSLRDWHVDREWTLFLDRDGVINRRIPDDYVRKWSEFEFLASTLNAMRRLANQFGVIVVVTNQRGIGRGLMSEGDLAMIHTRMVDVIQQNGGRIDRIYCCPHDPKDRCDCRKPNIGLALRAKVDFSCIDFARSIMVGDSASDMDFAKRAGMRKIWIGSEGETGGTAPDFAFASLEDFSRGLT